MPRKSTAAAVQCDYPLGKLVSLVSPRNSRLFMVIESGLLSESVIPLHDGA